MVVAILGVVGAAVGVIGNVVKTNKARQIQQEAIEGQYLINANERLAHQTQYLISEMNTKKLINVILLVSALVGLLIFIYFVMKNHG